MTNEPTPTTDITYRIMHNVGAGFMRGYTPGELLVLGWTGTVPAPMGDPTAGADGMRAALRCAAELVFERHNTDDRPDGQMAPSLSVGDVVVFGEVALTCAPVGWAQVGVDPDDITTESWREAFDRVHPGDYS